MIRMVVTSVVPGRVCLIENNDSSMEETGRGLVACCHNVASNRATTHSMSPVTQSSDDLRSARRSLGRFLSW